MICSKNGDSAGTVGWEINFFTQNIAMLDWSPKHMNPKMDIFKNCAFIVAWCKVIIVKPMLRKINLFTFWFIGRPTNLVHFLEKDAEPINFLQTWNNFYPQLFPSLEKERKSKIRTEIPNMIVLPSVAMRQSSCDLLCLIFQDSAKEILCFFSCPGSSLPLVNDNQPTNF